MSSQEKRQSTPFTASKTKITIAELNIYLQSINFPTKAVIDGYDSLMISQKTFKCWKNNKKWAQDINNLLQLQLYEDAWVEVQNKGKEGEVIKKYNQLLDKIQKPNIDTSKFQEAKHKMKQSQEKGSEGLFYEQYCVDIHIEQKNSKKIEEKQEKLAEDSIKNSEKQLQQKVAEQENKINEKNVVHGQKEPDKKQEQLIHKAGQNKQQNPAEKSKQIQNQQKEQRQDSQATQKAPQKQQQIKKQQKVLQLLHIFQKLQKEGTLTSSQIDVINQNIEGQKATMSQLVQYQSSQSKTQDKKFTFQNFQSWKRQKLQKKNKHEQQQQQQQSKIEAYQKKEQLLEKQNWLVNLLHKYLPNQQIEIKKMPQSYQEEHKFEFSLALDVKNQAKIQKQNQSIQIALNICSHNEIIVKQLSPYLKGNKDKNEVLGIKVFCQQPEKLKIEVDLLINQNKKTGSQQQQSEILIQTHAYIPKENQEQSKQLQEKYLLIIFQKLAQEGIKQKSNLQRISDIFVRTNTPKKNPLKLYFSTKLTKITQNSQINPFSPLSVAFSLQSPPKTTIIRQFKKKIELNHKDNKFALILFALNKNSNIHLHFTQIQEIDKFYQKLGTQRAAKKLPTIPETFQDFISIIDLQSSWLLKKIANKNKDITKVNLFGLCEHAQNSVTMEISFTAKKLSEFL